jgi:hypothetical protein
MHKAFTISPVTDDTGELRDFEVAIGNRLHNGMLPDIDSHYTEDEYGNSKFIEVEDPDQQMNTGGLDLQEYFDTVAETTPHIKEIIAWAGNDPAVPPSLIEEFNASLETGDLETFYNHLETLTGIWHDQGQPGLIATTEEHQAELDEWFDELDQETYDQTLEHLETTQFTMTDAQQFAEASASYEQGSVEHDLLKAGVDLSFNKTDFQTAFAQLTATHGESRVAAAYLHLKDRLN